MARHALGVLLARRAFGVLLAAVISAAPARAAEPTLTLSVSSWMAPSHVLSRTQALWCEEVAKATARRVRCRVLPRAVAAPAATFDAVRDGLADVSYSVHGYTPARFPLTRLVELPFGGDSAEATSVAYQRIFERHLAALDEHQGLKVLAVFTHGPGMIFSAIRPLASLSDMQELKWRVGGGMVNEIGRALGLDFVHKPATEIYDLLAAGRVDGVFLPAETIEAFKLDKLVRHRTSFRGGLYNTSFAMVMNPAAWARIGKADQAAIEALSGEVTARAFGRAFDRADRRALAYLQAAGVQAHQASRAFTDELRARTVALDNAWVRDARARGLSQPQEVLREFRAAVSALP